MLEDADIAAAAKLACAARLKNSGQVCINAKRFIVSEAIYDAFKEELIWEMLTYKVGDPREEDTKIGPLARKDLLENLKR